MLLSVVSWAPSLAKLNPSNISHFANFENFLQFPHRIITANFSMSYLPQYSSNLCNLGLHGYLLEKRFLTVGKLHQSDTRFESYGHFNLLPLKNLGIICTHGNFYIWHAMGCVGPMLEVQGMLGLFLCLFI